MSSLSRGAFALTVGLLASTVVCAETTVVSGGNVGAIPDIDPGGRVVTFDVSGIEGPVQDVTLTLGLTHTYAGDLQAVLTSPEGFARLIVFSRLGAGTTSEWGNGSNFGGSYGFSDDSTVDLWETSRLTGGDEIIADNTFRTSTAGMPLLSGHGGCSTSLRGAFGGLPAERANGTWSLTLTDWVELDVGSVDSASLTIESAPNLIFDSGFEAESGGGGVAAHWLATSGAVGVCNPALADFEGNGLTDFVVARSVEGQIEWHILPNLGVSATGDERVFTLGIPLTDVMMTGDLDGDGIADPVVWSSGLFKYLRSSRPSAAPVIVHLGSSGDDPTVLADYDNDYITDLAVLDIPQTSGDIGLSHIRSRDGAGVTVTLGTGSADSVFPIAGYDLSGDGRADIALQHSAGPGVAIWFVYDGTSGAVLDSFAFGLGTDLLIGGNYSGNDLGDITTVRGEAGSRVWRTQETGTKTWLEPVSFGTTFDFMVGGDYDGDGLADHAVFHPSANPGETRFMVRPSTNTATTREVIFGSPNDYPVASFQVH